MKSQNGRFTAHCHFSGHTLFAENTLPDRSFMGKHRQDMHMIYTHECVKPFLYRCAAMHRKTNLKIFKSLFEFCLKTSFFNFIGTIQNVIYLNSVYLGLDCFSE